MAVVVGCSGNAGGRLIAIDTTQAVPLILSLKYLEPFTSFSSVLVPTYTVIKLGVATGVQAEQSVAAQFQKAMDDAVYITPFGDTVGDVKITFIANPLCGSGANVNGFDVIQHYLDRRLQTNKNKLPATIVIGSGTFRGFLVGLLFNGRSGELPLSEGTLLFKAWPS